MCRPSILDNVRDYYTAKVLAHGATPRGVDWNSEASQVIRFEQLLRLVDPEKPGSIGDYGCGYGGLLDHLQARGITCEYRGFDISAEMIAEARRRHDGESDVVFTECEEDLDGTDYIVASGIFNVRLRTAEQAWADYVLETIDRLATLAVRGFAFNCLTSYSDVERMRADLFYADPCVLFDRCKRRYSRNVALLHDYELFEFTIVVRK